MKNGKKMIEGCVAIVTGGASGIGRATCHALAEQGAALCVADLNAAAIEETLEELRSEWPGLSIMGEQVDVQDQAQVERMVNGTLEKMGKIDILVHAAGILRGEDGTPRMLHDTSVEEFDRVVGTNLRGTFLCNRAVLPGMIKQRRGHIVNISSTSGIRGRAFDSVYCASKFGILGLSESVREEVRSYGIKVHVILPDAVDTPLWKQNGPISAPDYALSPDTVAGVIVHVLCLPEDVVLGRVIVEPMRSKRRRRSTKPASREEVS